MAIIGVSGKIGSGKDTVGNIVQYLVAKHESDYTFPDTEQDFKSFLKNNHVSHSTWQIKKFAYAVKQVCSILTGIPIDDFEKQEVKDRVLGEEWTRYGYADGFMRNMDGTPIMNNKQCSKERYEQEFRTNWQTAYKHEYTVRELLQLVGTNAIRNVIHEDAWVNALMSQYRCSCDHQIPFEDNIAHVEFDTCVAPNWVITDVRFENEAKAIKDRDGVIIRINRDDYFFDEDGKRIIPSKNYVNVPINQHPSETALDDYSFDYVISNNGTITQLIKQVKLILIKEKIITP